jgi:hypothetical protein
MDELLDSYFNKRQAIFDYFGYVEDWRVLPFDDAREYFWKLDKETGTVGFAEKEADLESEEGEYYENEIYTQRHLPKWVYAGKDFTLIVVDTHTDGNQFLQIFSNEKQRFGERP